MDKVKAPNRKIGRMLAKNLILLLVIAALCFVGMWAWFTKGATATASGISIKCDAPEGVDIAIVRHGTTPTDSDFSPTQTNVDLETVMNTGKTGDEKAFTLVDITGDGETFYLPKLTQMNGLATPTEGDWEIAEGGRDYVCFDLYFRSKAQKKIYFGYKSKVGTPSDILVGADSGNKSSYGDFSKDCLAGATRLSVVGHSTAVDANNLKFLWIPRPDIYLDASDGYNVTNAVVDGITNVHTYWTVDTANENRKVQCNYSDTRAANSPLVVSALAAGATEYTFGTSNEINKTVGEISTLTESKTYNSVDYYQDYVTVNLWIEGEDSESRLALSGGQFTLYVSLNADDVV